MRKSVIDRMGAYRHEAIVQGRASVLTLQDGAGAQFCIVAVHLDSSLRASAQRRILARLRRIEDDAPQVPILRLGDWNSSSDDNERIRAGVGPARGGHFVAHFRRPLRELRGVVAAAPDFWAAE